MSSRPDATARSCSWVGMSKDRVPTRGLGTAATLWYGIAVLGHTQYQGAEEDT
jgi:hypothetical protein